MASEATPRVSGSSSGPFSSKPQEDDPFLVPKQASQKADENEPLDGETDLQALLPAPLSHTTFSSDNFNVNDFLLSRRHTPLDELRSELRGYLTNLRTELVGVINRDYEDFIGLGIGLRGTDKRLERMRKPVEAVKASVESVRNDLNAIKEDIESKLDERTGIREQESTLRLLLSIHDSVLKVEALLLIPSPETSKSNGDVSAKDKSLVAGVSSPVNSSSAMHRTASQSSNSQRIERVAGEYNHLLYLVRKAEGMQYVKTLQPRMDHIATTLHQDLTALLSSLLSPSTRKRRVSSYGTNDPKMPSNSLAECLRTYLALGRPREAEEVIRRVLVRPWVNQHITREALSGPLSPRLPNSPASSLPVTSFDASTSATEPLQLEVDLLPTVPGPSQSLIDLYNQILHFISKDCAAVLDVADRQLASNANQPTTRPDKSFIEDTSASIPADRTFYVLSNVIWPEVTDRLTSELGHYIFASGRPDAFHANHTATQAFISRIESFCPTLHHLQYLRNHTAYSSFEKMWQLPVYFQLRLKEIVGALEESLAARDAAVPRTSNQESQFLMLASEAAHKAIWTCWQPQILLADLTPRFWRLTLQIISRYRTWLEEGVSPLVTATRQSSQSAMDRSFSAPASQAPSRTGTPQPQNANPEISDDRALRQLTAHVHDIRRFNEALTEFFGTRIQDLIPQPSPNDTEDIPRPEDLFRSALDALSNEIPRMATSIVTLLVKACAEPLKSVKPMGSQIRASNRKTGTEPSYFVSNILKPLREYRQELEKVLNDEDRQNWTTQVVNEVASRYTLVLVDLRKVEDSLRKLKKGKGRQGGFSLFGSKPSTPSNDPNEPEDDRVMVQMRRDVEAFLADAQELGVGLEGSEELQALQKEAQST